MVMAHPVETELATIARGDLGRPCAAGGAAVGECFEGACAVRVARLTGLCNQFAGVVLAEVLAVALHAHAGIGFFPAPAVFGDRLAVDHAGAAWVNADRGGFLALRVLLERLALLSGDLVFGDGVALTDLDDTFW
jgi:hypothetical protein